MAGTADMAAAWGAWPAWPPAMAGAHPLAMAHTPTLAAAAAPADEAAAHADAAGFRPASAAAPPAAVPAPCAGAVVRMRHFPAAWALMEELDQLSVRVTCLLESYGQLSSEPEVVAGTEGRGAEMVVMAGFAEPSSAWAAVQALDGVDLRPPEQVQERPPEPWELFSIQVADDAGAGHGAAAGDATVPQTWAPRASDAEPRPDDAASEPGGAASDATEAPTEPPSEDEGAPDAAPASRGSRTEDEEEEEEEEDNGIASPVAAPPAQAPPSPPPQHRGALAAGAAAALAMLQGANELGSEGEGSDSDTEQEAEDSGAAEAAAAAEAEAALAAAAKAGAARKRRRWDAKEGESSAVADPPQQPEAPEEPEAPAAPPPCHLHPAKKPSARCRFCQRAQGLQGESPAGRCPATRPDFPLMPPALAQVAATVADDLAGVAPDMDGPLDLEMGAEGEQSYLVVHGLHASWGALQVQALFTPFSGVAALRFVPDAEHGRAAFVKLLDEALYATAAQRLDGTVASGGLGAEACRVRCRRVVGRAERVRREQAEERRRREWEAGEAECLAESALLLALRGASAADDADLEGRRRRLESAAVSLRDPAFGKQGRRMLLALLETERRRQEPRLLEQRRRATAAADAEAREWREALWNAERQRRPARARLTEMRSFYFSARRGHARAEVHTTFATHSSRSAPLDQVS